MSSSSPLESPLPGTLRYELPHWAAEVRLYDNQLRLVTGWQQRVKPSVPTSLLEVQLPPGVYQVEMVLEAKKQCEWVTLWPGGAAELPKKVWKELTFTSAAPLNETSTSREWHQAPATEWSRKLTWTKGQGGDSRLFVFVRTLEPERYRAFASGLQLLNAAGELLTDFTTGVKKDAAHGWLAFTADLPAGYYLLRRVRTGVLSRYQPLYLCPGWETQLFIKAYRYQSLSAWSLNMARRGQGFQQDDQTAPAAEAVLDALRFNRDSQALVQSDHLRTLLQDKFDNPWLGILAAYGLSAPQAEPAADPTLRAHVQAFLAREIGTHPDVRALQLTPEQASPAPFPYPPLLRAGLQRVREYATRFASTVAVGSLTEWVLEHQVADSPWTAWRRMPAMSRRATRGASAAAAVAREVAEFDNLATTKVATAADFTQAAPPTAPVYYLPAKSNVAASSAASQTPLSAQSLTYAPLIQMVRQKMENGELDQLPERIAFDEMKEVHDLLARVEPGRVSAACGLPLARAEYGLQQLKAGGQNRLTPMQQVMLEQASAPMTPSNAAPTTTEAPISIEELVSRLRIVADRLTAPATDEAKSYRANTGAQTQAERLQKLADRLLTHADFTVLTNPQGELLYGNGAFLHLMEPPAAPSGKKTRRVPPAQTWPQVLRQAAPGHSQIKLAAPATPWNLQRTAIVTPSGDVLAYLNVLRQPDAAPLPPDTLQHIEGLLPDVAHYSALYVHGSDGEKNKYAQRLETLTQELSTLL